jgi:RNA polymerase sigma factor (sigma-70 family)
MVWGVCRRIVGNHHDAEDAFQATFLVLVRKAASVRQKETVGNWLYGVANLTSRKARAMLAKRRKNEVPVAAVAEPAAPEQDSSGDLQAVLDQELSRLPDKYRAPIVLCDLQGKSYKEAASELRCRPGTLSARIARGRAMLAKRLVRQGVGVSSGAVAVALSHAGASASVPGTMVSSTIQAAIVFAAGQAASAGVISAQAAVLTEGVLKTMLLKKLHAMTVVLLAMIAGVALCGFLGRTHAAAPPTRIEPQVALGQENKPKADKSEKSDQELPSKTGREITSAFQHNKARVDEDFLGKKMQVTGKMFRVDRVGLFMKETEDQHYFLTFAAEPKEDKKPEGPSQPETEAHIAFVFPASARKQLAELERGQLVTIEGVCEGKKAANGRFIEDYVLFGSCKIVKGK